MSKPSWCTAARVRRRQPRTARRPRAAPRVTTGGVASSAASMAPPMLEGSVRFGRGGGAAGSDAGGQHALAAAPKAAAGAAAAAAASGCSTRARDDVLRFKRVHLGGRVVRASSSRLMRLRRSGISQLAVHGGRSATMSSSPSPSPRRPPRRLTRTSSSSPSTTPPEHRGLRRRLRHAAPRRAAASATLFQRAYAVLVLRPVAQFLPHRAAARLDARLQLQITFVSPASAPTGSLPSTFGSRGYLTLAAGKLFHPGLPPNFDAAQLDASGTPQVRSWTRFVSRAGPRQDLPLPERHDKQVALLQPQVTNVECPATADNCAPEAVVAGEVAGSTSVRGRHHQAEPTAARRRHRQRNRAPPARGGDATALRRLRPAQTASAVHVPEEFADLYPPAARSRRPSSESRLPACRSPPGTLAASTVVDNPTPPANASVYRRATTARSRTLTTTSASPSSTHSASPTTMVVAIGDHGWRLGEMNL